MHTPSLIKYLSCFVLTWLGFHPVCLAQAEKNVSLIVNNTTGFIEIRNGLLGIVVPGKPAVEANTKALAPIQSFIYSDGVYSDNTVNYLQTVQPALSTKVNILTRTAEEVAVQIEYRFQKERYEFSREQYKGGEQGPGFYRCLLKIRKGERSIVIEEEADYEIIYSVKISNGLTPDKARYRGWVAASAQQGYEPNGAVYRSEDQRGYPLDATVDLDYKKTFTYPRLVLWEPAGGEINTGRYWQVFNSRAGNSANLLGFFQGKPSRLVGAKFAGPALQVTPGGDGGKENNIAEIAVSIYRRAPDNSFLPRKRYQWAVFISTKKDLLPPEQYQPIARELNRLSGLGAVVTGYLSKPAVLIPAFYKGAIYLSADKITAIRQRIKEDRAFYELLYNNDSWYRPVWDAWRYPDSARSLVRQMLQVREDLLYQYQEGEGTYAARFRYWKGALNFKLYALIVSCLFAGDNIAISASDKKKLEQLVVMMARVVWNDDNVPMFDGTEVNYGPANMAIQYRNNARIFFSLLLANDPEFSGRAKKAIARINQDIEQAIYKNGSSFGTPHYTQASITPILFSALQLKQAGVADLFRTNRKITQFARFYSALLTPPSPRFMNNRKLISFGDGSEESSPAFALLSTGLEPVDKKLSEQLSAQFFYGPPRFDIAGPVALAADLSRVPAKTFTATSCNYSGYLSHFRAAVNTPNETAVWVLNGDSLFDHRNDDAGQLAIYALQAPVSVNGSSFYSPPASDSRVKSVVVPEQLFPEWKEAAQPIGERSLTNRTWPSSNLVQFAVLGHSASTTVRMSREGKEWYRKISLLSFFDEQPVIVFYDSVTGKGPNIWSLPVLSEGAVQTPAGNITPVQRVYNNNNRKELPQATPVKRISEGLQAFTFNGQQWITHPSQGIDWKLYTCSDDAMEFTLSDWVTTWQNTPEQQDFKQANKRNYEEEQQFLRLKSSRPFFNVLLPYKKGKTDPYAGNVKELPGRKIAISQRNHSILLTPGSFGIRTSRATVAGLWSDKERFNEWGISIAGGYTEIEYNENELMIRVHGNTGTRKIMVPFPCSPAKKYPGLASQTTGSGTNITIGYKELTKNIANGEIPFTEYLLKRQ